MKKLSNLWPYFLIVIVTLLTFSNSFLNEFAWDDLLLIVHNPAITSLKKFFVLFKKPLAIEPRIIFHRPLLILSYALDYAVWKLNPFGYHLTNIVFHTLNGILCFILIRLISKCFLVSFFTALLYLVHPVQGEAVTYISGRADLLSSIFVLSTLLFYFKFLEIKEKKYYLFSLLTLFAGLFVKVITVVVIPLIIIYELIFHKLKKEKILYALGFLGVVSLFTLNAILFFTQKKGLLVLTTAQPLSQRLLKSVASLLDFFSFLFYPFGLYLERAKDVRISVLNPKFGFSLGILILCIVLAVWLFKKDKEKLFFFTWFFVSLMPIANIILPTDFIPRAHFLYIPAQGLIYVIISALHDFFNKGKIKPRIFKGICSLMIAGCAVLTFGNNKIWKTERGLYLHNLKYTSKSANLHFNLGRVYIREHQFEKAEKQFLEAKKICKEAILFFYGELWKKHKQTGNLKAADEILATIKAIKKGQPLEFLAKLKLKGNIITPYATSHSRADEIEYNRIINEYFGSLKKISIGLGTAYLNQQKLDPAFNVYKRALKIKVLKEEDAGIFLNLGIIHQQKREFDEGEQQYKQALKIKANYPEAYNNLAVLYRTTKKRKLAIQYFKKSIQLDPLYFLPYKNLIEVYMEKKENNKVEALAKQAALIFQGEKAAFFKEFLE